MQKDNQSIFELKDFVPSLVHGIERESLNLGNFIRVAVPIEKPVTAVPVMPTAGKRNSVHLTDGKNICLWEADSLQALFRGDKQPPELGAYPVAYNDSFALLDQHVLEISNLFGDRRDAEMKEIYSALRRRPDGRSLGFVHDYMWQAAALVLGTRPLSQAEFEAIMSRLERSCRTFERGSSSRNYVMALRTTFE